MSRKMEQFISDLDKAPQGKLTEPSGEKLSVPKSIRRRAGREIGDTMRDFASVSESDNEHTDERVSFLEDEIKELENQRNVVGEEIYNDIVLPAIEEKRIQLKKIIEDAEVKKEKPKKSLSEKKEKTKEILRNIAEKENIESQKINTALVYLPEKVLSYAANYCLSALGGEEKFKEKIIADYLSGKSLPAQFIQQIQKAEGAIKSAKIKKLDAVSDVALRQKLSDAVANTPVTEMELGQSLVSVGYTKNKDISLAVINMAMDDAVVANQDLEITISAASVANGEKMEEIVLWLTKERSRYAELIGQSRKRKLLSKERAEVSKLQDKEEEIKSKEKTWGGDGTDRLWAFLEEFKGLKESAFQLNNFSDEAGKLIDGLGADFEIVFTNKLNQARLETGKIYADYVIEKQRATEFEEEVKRIMADFESSDLDNEDLKVMVDRLVEIKKQIDRVQKNILLSARRAKEASVDYDHVLREVLSERKNKMWELSRKILGLSSPKKWEYEFEKKKTGVRDRLKEAGERADEKNARSEAFEKNIDRKQKIDVLNNDNDKIRSLIKEANQDQQYNSAWEALSNIFGVISIRMEKMEKEKSQFVRGLEKIDKETEIIIEEIEKLKGRSLVWGKKEKLKTLEDKMEEKNNERVVLEKERDSIQIEIQETNNLQREIQKIKKNI